MVVDCKGNIYSFGCPEYGQLGNALIFKELIIIIIVRFFFFTSILLSTGHNSDGKFIARAQRIEFDCELIPRRVAIFIEKTKDGQVMPVPNVVVRDVVCGANHTVSNWTVFLKNFF